MILHVQYSNYHYDYVDNRTLDRPLAGRSIRQFYRPSEKKWVNVFFDPVRGMGGYYHGINRRKFQKAL
jgi:hypothetical protein